MAIKTFNIDEKIHKIYSEHCKKEGISMSRKVENFIRQELESIKRRSGNPQKQEFVAEKPIGDFSKYCN
jgi:hypothetical protein